MQGWICVFPLGNHQKLEVALHNMVGLMQPLDLNDERKVKLMSSANNNVVCLQNHK